MGTPRSVNDIPILRTTTIEWTSNLRNSVPDCTKISAGCNLTFDVPQSPDAFFLKESLYTIDRHVNLTLRPAHRLLAPC